MITNINHHVLNRHKYHCISENKTTNINILLSSILRHNCQLSLVIWLVRVDRKPAKRCKISIVITLVSLQQTFLTADALAFNLSERVPYSVPVGPLSWLAEKLFGAESSLQILTEMTQGQKLHENHPFIHLPSVTVKILSFQHLINPYPHSCFLRTKLS